VEGFVEESSFDSMSEEGSEENIVEGVSHTNLVMAGSLNF
jgi:hypothetical protein